MVRFTAALVLFALVGLALAPDRAHAEDLGRALAKVDVGVPEDAGRLTRRVPDATDGIISSAFTPATEGVLYQAAPVRQTSPAPRKDWHVIVATYLWASDISGTSYSNGEATDIDIAFGDLFEKLDYAVIGYVEGRYKRWSLAVDGSVLGLSGSRTGPLVGAQLGAELTQTIIDVRLGYTVFCKPGCGYRWGRCCYPSGMNLDAILGARYWNLEQDVQVAIPGGPIVERGSTTSWWDPYVGARFRWQFAKRWGLTAYGDVGGFGISDASELTWMFQAHVRYFITRGFFVSLGYRALDVDRVEGTGATRNGIDATYHGPVLGLGYVF